MGNSNLPSAIVVLLVAFVAIAVMLQFNAPSSMQNMGGQASLKAKSFTQTQHLTRKSYPTTSPAANTTCGFGANCTACPPGMGCRGSTVPLCNGNCTDLSGCGVGWPSCLTQCPADSHCEGNVPGACGGHCVLNTTNSTNGCGDPSAGCSVTCPSGWSCMGYTPGGCGGNCTGPLSVHWNYYKATCQGKDKILIEWQTLDERDTMGFIVQWSNNAAGPYNDASPFINAMGPYYPYSWLDLTSDISPFSPQVGIYNWYKVRELCINPPFCSETSAFTTPEICQDETPQCGGIRGLQCPEGYQCVCPKPNYPDQLCDCVSTGNQSNVTQMPTGNAIRYYQG